jgi:hypothetical protein
MQQRIPRSAVITFWSTTKNSVFSRYYFVILQQRIPLSAVITFWSTTRDYNGQCCYYCESSLDQNGLDLISHGECGGLCTIPHLNADLDLSQSLLREITATAVTQNIFDSKSFASDYARRFWIFLIVCKRLWSRQSIFNWRIPPVPAHCFVGAILRQWINRAPQYRGYHE